MKVVLEHPNNMLLGDVYWKTAGDALNSLYTKQSNILQKYASFEI